VLLFEPDVKSRRRMLPFVALGGATALYTLWGLTPNPSQVYVEGNSIVYINPATHQNRDCGALCDRDVRLAILLEVRAMVIFGAANFLILMAVMAVRRYAFTSLWCAYAAVASIIILVYFWRSSGSRPFRYA